MLDPSIYGKVVVKLNKTWYDKYYITVGRKYLWTVNL